MNIKTETGIANLSIIHNPNSKFPVTMKFSSTAASFLICFSVSTSASKKDYLRKTRGEKTRFGRLIDFTWVNQEDDNDADASTTSPTFASPHTTNTLSSATENAISSTEIVTLPTISNTDSTTTMSTASSMYTWTAMCTSDTDCYPKLRIEFPGDNDPIAVEVCGCYANTINNPFNECQGTKVCSMASCFRNSCDGASAYCNEGVCILQQPEDMYAEATVSPIKEVPMVQTGAPSLCVDDSQCADNFICLDKSNGNCFFPPCGHCTAPLEDVNDTLILAVMSMSMPNLSSDGNDFDFGLEKDNS